MPHRIARSDAARKTKKIPGWMRDIRDLGLEGVEPSFDLRVSSMWFLCVFFKPLREIWWFGDRSVCFPFIGFKLNLSLRYPLVGGLDWWLGI